jgi:hypothetical protein
MTGTRARAKPRPAAAARRRWPARAETWLFLVVTAATLVPVWSVPYFPAQDGPAHVDTAHAIRHYLDAALPYQTYYQVQLQQGSNWLLTLVLAGLMFVVRPSVAEKLLVSGYIVLFVAGVRYALAAIAAENRWLALFAPLVVYNVTLHLGFYNFVYSVAFFPIALGYWIRCHPDWTARRTVGFAAIVLVLYFLHPISMAMLAVAVAAGTVWPWRGVRASWPAVAAFVPAGAFFLLFAARPGAGDGGMAHAAPFRLQDLWFLRAFSAIEVWFCLAVFGLLGLLVGHRLYRRALAEGARGHQHGLLLCAPLYVVVYALTPDFVAGGGWVKMRLAIYPVLVLLLWTSASRFGVWSRRAVQAACLGLLATQLVFYVATYRLINDELADFSYGMDQIEPGSTVLPLSFDAHGPVYSPDFWAAQPFLHAAGRLAADRDAMNLLNYQGNFDYFAVRYRPERNPFRYITNGGEKDFQKKGPIDFATYGARTGGRVDYVLVWGLRTAYASTESVQDIVRQLRSGYELISTSPTGKMMLFVRKDRAGARPPN